MKNKKMPFTVKELLDRIYVSTEYNEVMFYDGVYYSGTISKNDVIKENYGEYADRQVLKFGFYDGKIEIALYI